MTESGTSFTTFDPTIIPFQRALVQLVENWDYNVSTPEILCSGAYGSSKSLCAAHLIVKHCLGYRGAVVCIGRRALPDIKKTIYKEIVDHLDCCELREGKDYITSDTRAEITFPSTYSKVISASWADRRYKKFRSLKLSMFVLEEAAENDERDREAFMAIKARMRRIEGVRGPVLVLTNPSSEEHWLYEYFIEGQKKYATRKVLYSVTTDNCFLDPAYIEQLQQDLSPKEARRYLYGQWLSLVEEVVYYEYNPDDGKNYSTEDYQIDAQYPVGMTWDFNIAQGKPMSAVLFQYLEHADTFHFFDESIIHTARTSTTLEDMEGRGLLEDDTAYIVCGDAAGKHRDTRSKKTDYDIIYGFLENKNIDFERMIPPANPPVRTRHNIVNSYCMNASGKRRLIIYKKCKVLHKGMKITKLKPGSSYIEDDSNEWQHSTTALGYAVCAIEKKKKRNKPIRGRGNG